MAKREITAGDKPIPIKSPNAPKAQERELDRGITYMLDLMAKRFRNQVFKELNAGTVEKFADAQIDTLAAQAVHGDGEFADAQIGNYAKVYLGLANKVTRKLIRQFDDKRIEAMVSGILGKVDQRNREELYKRIENRIGLSTKELSATEGLSANINALTLETAQWVKKLRDDTLEAFTANSLKAMTQGQSLEEVMQQFDGLVEKRRNHARTTARTQIANFNSIATKLRAQNLGITRARWITSRDERVRGRPGGKYPDAKPSHWDLHGKEFDLVKGLKAGDRYLLPGVDYNCRCDYELIIPEDGGE